MSSFTTGRRGHNVNMSQYLQTLNEIRNEPSPEDTTATLDDELAVFANTDFVDWDGPVGTAHHNSPAAAPTPASTSTTVSAATPMIKQAATPAPPNTDPLADLTTFDFNLDGYGFDFNPYTSSGVPAFTENLGALQPLQPTPNYPSHVQRGAFVPAGPPSGEKRKSESLPAPRQLSFEEQSRIAAEEDKRRRNTAASARFRVKKKAREQALEKSQKEYAEKILALEGRISTLETENKWLRELVMEKNGGSKETVSTLLDGQKEKESAKSS